MKMKKTIALSFVFIMSLSLLATLALAATQDSGDTIDFWKQNIEEKLPVELQKSYVTVVDEDAPSSDVITAANFAGAMASMYGVKFGGATTQMAQGFREQDLETRFIVVVDGTHANLIIGKFADSRMREVALSAEEYFEKLGFTVTKINNLLADPEDVQIEEWSAPAVSEAEAETDAGADAEDVPESSEAVAENTVLEPETVAAPVDSAPEPEQKNLFQRFIGWIKGLFE